jgi:hypothetical protein
METLKSIQTVNKIGKILSKIAFIFSIIGICGCIVGILGITFGAETLKIGGVTLHGILQKGTDLTGKALCASMAAGIILCTGEAVLSKFAEHYYKRTLLDGTPFCLDGAKELCRLGILAICVPIGTQIIAKIVYAVLAQSAQDTAPFAFDNSASVALGVMFILMSLICRYGAELGRQEQ